jgi:hypothetical protein
MIQANRDAHDLFTTKTTPPQNITMSDHRITTHFNTMTKVSDTLFDGKLKTIQNLNIIS